MFERDNVKNEAIRRDLLLHYSRSWQHQKRSNSARLPHFSKLTTSKTKQLCGTSSFFEVDNIKNERILRDLIQKWKVECRADGLVPMRFAIFHSTCLKYCACHEKVMPGHTKCCTCHAKSSQQNWRSEAPKWNPPRKSAPGPPNSSDEDVSCTAPAMENASLQILFKCPTPAIVFGNATKPSRFAHFWQGPQSLAPAGTTSERPKVVRTPGVFNILTSKCASPHNGVHFFDISTSKSGPSVFSFFTSKCASRRHGVHFFDIATSKSGPKLSEAAVFCTFWLGNVLRATTACTFSTSQLPKVVRTWCVTFWLGNVLRATTACTFSTSQLPKWSEAGVLCTFWLRNVLRATAACTFSSLIWPDGSAPAALASLVFDPPEPQNIGKTQCFATFLPFRASASSFFLLFLFYSSFF